MGVVARDGACGAYVAGALGKDPTTLLGMPISASCAAEACAVVGHLDADGALLWLKVYDPGADSFAYVLDLGLSADGQLVLGGGFSGTLDLGTGPMNATIDDTPFLGALSAEGDGLWSRSFPISTSVALLGSLAVGEAGDLVVNGIFSGEIDFGAGPVTGPPGAAYLASFDALGKVRFGKVLGNPPSTSYWTVALDASGDVLIAGIAQGFVDLGGGPIAGPGSHTIVARLDAMGNHLWSRSIADGVPGAPSDEYGMPLAVDANGHIWVGGVDGALLELDGAGATVASHSLGATGHAWCAAVDFGPNGAPVIAGVYDGTVDLGQGPLTAAGVRATFVAALAP